MKKLKELISIMKKYNIDTTLLENELKDIPNFKVTTTIIGGFSTVKS